MNTAAFFDVDNTIVKGQTQYFLARYLYDKKKISLIKYLNICCWFFLYKLGLLKDVSKINKNRKQFYRIFSNHNVKEYKCYFEDLFLSVIKPKIYSDVKRLIVQHKKESHIIILLSASLTEIIDELKDFLNANYIIATKLKKEKEKYTGDIENNAIFSKIKAKSLIEFARDKNIDLKKSYFYTDSLSDLEGLKLVGNPVVVNPEKELKKIALRNNWKMYTFNI